MLAVLLTALITSTPCKERLSPRVASVAIVDEKKSVSFRLMTEFHPWGTYEPPPPIVTTLAVYPSTDDANVEYVEAHEWTNGNLFKSGSYRNEMDGELATALSKRMWREIVEVKKQQGDWVTVCLDACTDIKLLNDTNCSDVGGEDAFWYSWPGRAIAVLKQLAKKEIDRGAAEKQLRVLLDETTPPPPPQYPIVGPAPNVVP